MSMTSLSKKIFRLLTGVCMGLLCWITIAPVAWLMPRRKDWLAIIGRDDGKFTDNTKYFMLEANALLPKDIRCVFVTERADAAALLSGAGYRSLIYPSRKSIWFLLRTGSVVVDSNQWDRRLRGYLLIGTKLVQLWHGVGFKRIQRDRLRHESKGWISSRPIMAIRMLALMLRSGKRQYDLVNTTSRFYRDNVFSPAFNSRHFLLAGYPRNTFGLTLLSPESSSLTWATVDSHIRQQLPRWGKKDSRLVLVTPTYRDTCSAPLNLEHDTLMLLDKWCDAHNVEILFKFHPLEKGTNAVQGRHLHVCDSGSDIYPIMPLSSALITDYSSIYTDYLFLDKPILFLTPDLEEYINTSRQIQFDFEAMTPGPKIRTWHALLEELESQWHRDDYVEIRKELKSKAFDNFSQEMATKRILQFMFAKNWLASTALDYRATSV